MGRTCATSPARRTRHWRERIANLQRGTVAPELPRRTHVTSPWPSAPVALDVVDSTMEEARVRAAKGAPHGTTVLARAQRAGRGRTGARWDSPRDAGLYATTLLYVPADRALGGLSPALALACRDALADVGVEVQLKWPNDVWASGHKLAGLLLQREPLGPTGCCVLVGLGINLTAAAVATAADGAATPRVDVGVDVDADVDRAPPPRTTLEAVRGAPLTSLPLWAAVRVRWQAAYAAWLAEGLSPATRDRYDACHALHGLEVAAAGAEGPVRGRVVGLQPCGGLLLDGPKGPTLVRAGAVARVRPAAWPAAKTSPPVPPAG